MLRPQSGVAKAEIALQLLKLVCLVKIGLAEEKSLSQRALEEKL
jgi:hypothetical protein